MGWSLVGLRAQRRSHFVRGTRCVEVSNCRYLALYSPRYTMLPALSSEGLVYTKIIVGPYDGDSFVRYIENLVEHMNPYPAPKSILLMDNCSIHHVEGVSELCSAR
ncbi:hypothetical protein BJ322DRAFT_1003074 [Thelephora terrestris]|uniref:Tc1-like transposase DDE domain-containing protein n=1 Tax=Thelephora terrestris TaxID=56493 RepID=A0A9P6HHY6_9AGAM|nr:hypothetical protein BJ322DRAFT_1003074 [Thelephora terrestris]